MELVALLGSTTRERIFRAVLVVLFVAGLWWSLERTVTSVADLETITDGGLALRRSGAIIIVHPIDTVWVGIVGMIPFSLWAISQKRKYWRYLPMLLVVVLIIAGVAITKGYRDRWQEVLDKRSQASLESSEGNPQLSN